MSESYILRYCSSPGRCITIRVLMVSTGIITQHAPAAAKDPMIVFSMVVPDRPYNVKNNN